MGTAFTESSALYSIITNATIEEYNTLMNPDNYAAQLMFVHFFVIEYVAGAEVLGAVIDRSFLFRKKLVMPWVQRVRKALPPEYLPYMDWPLKFAERLVEFDRTLKLTI